VPRKVIIIILVGFCHVFGAQRLLAERPINELPMYGGQHDPQVPEDKKASDGAAKLGWEYYDKGDYGTAMKRFNQAWMFNRKNAAAYWGFGVILGERAREEAPEKNLRESIRYLEKAQELSSRDARLLVDLAFSEMLLGSFLQDDRQTGFQEHFNKARTLLQSSEKKDRIYPLLHFNWSLLNFFEGNYAQALEKLNTAKKLGFAPPPGYEEDLKNKKESVGK